MVERFFRDITDKGMRRVSFASVAELEIAIDLSWRITTSIPSHSVWTARATHILAKATRAKAAG